jgi:hypothetical protein
VITTAAQIVFGSKGNAAPYQTQGWAEPHDEIATWCIGPEAALHVPLAPGEGDLLVEFVLEPWVRPPILSGQRLAVSANGAPVGSALVQIESALGFRVERSLLGNGEEVDIALRCPDATSPADLRVSGDTRKLAFGMREARAMWVPPETPVYARRLPPLPVAAGRVPDAMAPAVRAITGLSLPDLMVQLESLGYNCELGLLQRACGAEPLGLLRFVGISVPRLLEGLDFCFEGVDDPAETRLFPNWEGKTEWIVSNLRYDMHWHTFHPVVEAEKDGFRRDELKKLQFKRRMFVETLEAGQKLFVYQRPEHTSVAHVLPILNLLRSHGDNALLFISQGHEAPSGSVDRLSANLYRGNIDRLAPIGWGDDAYVCAWISICANAYRLWREAGHGG